MKAHFELHWPKDGTQLKCFVHRITNHRYHWHMDEYELRIMLAGKQEFCCGMDTILLEEDDVVLLAPGVGHASMGRSSDTCALVLRFTSNVFRPFVKKGSICSFPGCVSNKDNRYQEKFQKIRFYAASIYREVYKNSNYMYPTVRANLDLLLLSVISEFEAEKMNIVPEDKDRQRMIRCLLNYVEEHYAEKITLEDLAKYSSYNRTYISTLFKTMVGINFHEYLTRVRFQHALEDLARSNDNLTDIALRNGFPDLKNYTLRFRKTMQRSPAEYRSQLPPGRIMPSGEWNFLSLEEPQIEKKIRKYLREK